MHLYVEPDLDHKICKNKFGILKSTFPWYYRNLGINAIHYSDNTKKSQIYDYHTKDQVKCNFLLHIFFWSGNVDINLTPDHATLSYMKRLAMGNSFF